MSKVGTATAAVVGFGLGASLGVAGAELYEVSRARSTEAAFISRLDTPETNGGFNTVRDIQEQGNVLTGTLDLGGCAIKSVTIDRDQLNDPLYTAADEALPGSPVSFTFRNAAQLAGYLGVRNNSGVAGNEAVCAKIKQLSEDN